MAPDPRAVAGFTDAGTYERGRPGYPAAAVDAVLYGLDIGPRSAVVDLAAGTGKLTRRLAGRVGRLVAVEPSAAMRAGFASALPGVRVRDGTAEAIPLPDVSVDAVLVAEAFHWFDVTVAAREIARVLRPRGGLGLLWNVATWTGSDTPWLGEFRGLLAEARRVAGDFPSGDGAWAVPAATGTFEPFTGTHATHVQHLDRAGFRALVSSWSWVATLPEPARAALLADVETLLAGQDRVVIPYRTEVRWARRR